MCNAKRYWFLVQRAERAYNYTKNANENIFGYLFWGCLKCAMPKGFLAQRVERAFVRNKRADKGVFGHLASVCLQCTMPKNSECLVWHAQRTFVCSVNKNCSNAAHRTRLPLHQKCRQKCLWIPSMMGVFELQNASKHVFLVCRAEHASLGTENTNNSVLGHLVKYTMA